MKQMDRKEEWQGCHIQKGTQKGQGDGSRAAGHQQKAQWEQRNAKIRPIQLDKHNQNTQGGRIHAGEQENAQKQ